MASRRTKAFIGVAMTALGLVQAGSFGVQSSWLFSALGLVYAGLGVAFLWTEVYATGS